MLKVSIWDKWYDDQFGIRIVIVCYSYCYVQSKRYKSLFDEASVITKWASVVTCLKRKQINYLFELSFQYLSRMMLHKLNARYELPSRKHFMDVVIPKLYRSTRDNVHQKLSLFEYYSTTTDIWTSRNMSAYMSVTVHVSIKVN